MIPKSCSAGNPINVNDVVLAIDLTTPTNNGVASVVHSSSPTAAPPTCPKLEPVPVTVVEDVVADIVPAPEDSYVFNWVNVEVPAILTDPAETTSLDARIDKAKLAVYPKPNLINSAYLIPPSSSTAVTFIRAPVPAPDLNSNTCPTLKSFPGCVIANDCVAGTIRA